MSTKPLKEMIAVMQAAEEGKEIECMKLRTISPRDWGKCYAPGWNWYEYAYRVKPVKPMTIPWDAIDPHYQWAAVDHDGVVYIYQLKPSMGGSHWSCGGGDYTGINGVLMYDRGDVAWNESLIQRPE